jgi:hypothetical protein
MMTYESTLGCHWPYSTSAVGLESNVAVESNRIRLLPF